MKKIIQFFLSTTWMGILLLVLAFAMALATFLESSWGTDTAGRLVYHAHWFELIFVLLGVNLLGHVVHIKTYRLKKLPVVLFHLAFLLIVIGAGVTRYFSSEGMMHIREGKGSSSMLSAGSYLSLSAGEHQIQRKVMFSELAPGGFDETLLLNGRPVRFRSVGFIRHVLRKAVARPSGVPLVDLVISAGRGMHPYVFQQGDSLNLDGVTVGFGTETGISLIQQGDSLFIRSGRKLEIRTTEGEQSQIIPDGFMHPVRFKQCYAMDGLLLLVRRFYPEGLIHVTRDASENSEEDAVLVEVTDGEEKKIIPVFGHKGKAGEPVCRTIGKIPVQLAYGSLPLPLPFELLLHDFRLERYPGSQSPSSFISEIRLIDRERQLSREVCIFMNNTLKYRGYRFYQSSYDADERGTVLWVNRDFWGTRITYAGYFLMSMGMLLSLFCRNSYFRQLVRRLKRMNRSLAAVLTLLLLGSSFGSRANQDGTAAFPALDPELVSAFEQLWVQGRDGRIEPVSTLCGEILRKLSRKSAFSGKSPAEVVLGMQLYPGTGHKLALIKIDGPVSDRLGIRGKYAAAADFFDEQERYLLLQEVQTAYGKMPAMRSKLDKSLIEADERLNICIMVCNGSLFTLFPPVNTNDPWHSAGSRPAGYNAAADSLLVNRSFQMLRESLNPGSDLQPLEVLASVTVFQEKYGGVLLPSAMKKSAEIHYNRLQPFKRLFPWYMLAGFSLLLLLFVNIFRQKILGGKALLVWKLLIVTGFMFHSGGLILRWYVSGHAPWSNGYESMVYVAWTAMLAGLILGRRYPMVLGTAAFMAGLTLFVAHLNWMNPEITNLVPVLKSYWLLIHVAVITASYGFIGLSAFLGMLVLLLYALMTEGNRKTSDRIIDRLTVISELSVIAGLYLLTIGTFLGGVWANESWGRYWGWDPKETWALISVLVYAFVAHMRMIPSLKGRYNYNLATVIGFSSVLMTYFGVNYFLSGMHSYGKGSIDGLNCSVYLFAAAVFGLILLSYLKFRKFEEKRVHE
ncbi:MAG: cytochrome c biogenesis protein CcsA [Mangrovibacterium sp.]